jgi:hypothetical protein
MTNSWMTTLDAFESHLDVQAGLIENGRYNEVVEFTPPADLPVMPRPLVSRASQLLSRAQTLTEQARATRDEIGQKLAHSPRPVFAQRAAPVYVDHQA